MATLYSNTGTPDGFVSSNQFSVTVSPPVGTVSAIITNITLSFHQAVGLPYGPGTMQCSVKLVDGSFSNQVVTDPFTFDITNQVKSFDFLSVNAKIASGNIIEFNAGDPGSWPWPYYSIYKDTVSAKIYVSITGSWVGGGGVVYAEGTKTVIVTAIVDYITGPGKAWNPAPIDNQENIAIVGRTRINTLMWNAPTDETPDYKVYFRAFGGSWELQETITDGSTSHTLSLDIRNSLAYYYVYQWRIDTVAEGLTTTGDTWGFITQQEGQFTAYTRRSDYDADKVWQPGTGWVDIDSFEYTGGGRFKGRVLVVGHKVIYFGDL